MSQLVSNPPADAKTPTTEVDPFAGLDAEDKDMLDLTTPLKSGKKEEKKETKPEDKEEEPELDAEGNPIEKEEEVEEDPLAEIEEELEEVSEEKLELTTPVRRKEILKKYPNLFKDFPYLEKAYYREQQFTELLPTIKDAKQAVEDQKVLHAYYDDMVEKGNTNNVLKMIKDNNPDTFNQVVDNYLSNLEKVDKDAYTHVLGNVVKNTILGMIEEAKESKDRDLLIAAKLLNKYAFGTEKFTHPTKLAKEGAEKKDESSLSVREQQIIKQQLDNATGDINSRVTNTIKSAIDQHIDPKGHMTDFIKGVAVDKALDKINTLISQDKRFQTILDKLWDKAAKDNFSKSSQDEIKRAYLAKAKGLLTPVLQSVRNEALRGMGKRVKEEVVDDNDTGEKPQRAKSEKNTERRLSSDNKANALDKVKGMSSLEALNQMMGD